MNSRRRFLKQSIAAGSLFAGAAAPALHARGGARDRARDVGNGVDDEEIKAVLEKPVLRRDLVSEEVIIESVDLLKVEDVFLVRARGEAGATGYAVCNWGMATFWPVFVGHVGPFFEGKDARDLDQLITDCFLADSHYKMQSMAIWTPIASAELAILDLLGKVSGRSVNELLGGRVRPDIEIYWANNHRGHSAEESVRRIVEQYREARPPAVKVKVGGRMADPEEPAGRTEKMLPMLREELGDDVVIYADANGGYDVDQALRVGRMLEEIDAGFFEEPCPFYDLWATKEVTDTLDIPVAAGEQESAQRRFRWVAANRGADVLQPDLFYYGGLTRSIRVARMAEAVGLTCTPHVSGGGINMLYIAHFAGTVPNAGPYQEYKSPNTEIPYEIPDGQLIPEAGQIPVPTGPGLGFHLDPDWVQKGEMVTRHGAC